jgi:serine/threonine protein kinase
MLYEMVTVRVPFSDYDEQSIISQHLSESVVPPSQSRRDMPPALESIILRLLAKNLQDRLASAQQVCQALEQIVVASERAAARNNLPLVSTSIGGRENEIAQAQQLVESSRLVTLLGGRGIGKTQLAVAIAARLTDEFSDGVWLVELESCSAAT